MANLFLSARITNSFFTTQEIEQLKEELKLYSNKSEFLRKIIKEYLHRDQPDTTDQLQELKLLIQKNQNLLQELKTTGVQVNSKKVKETYEGTKQAEKTDQALNLLDQF